MKDASAGAWAIARKDAATAAPWSSSLQHTTTLDPALTNSYAQPLPIPLLPPVTITTLSAYRKHVIWTSVAPRSFRSEFRRTQRHSISHQPIRPPKYFDNNQTDWSRRCPDKT